MEVRFSCQFPKGSLCVFCSMAPVNLLCVFLCFFTLFRLHAAFQLPSRNNNNNDGGHSAESQFQTWFGPENGEFVHHNTHQPPIPLPPHLLLLPMFRFAPVNFPEMELLRPIPGHRAVPNSITGALLPALPQRHTPGPGPVVRNGRGVELWCGYTKVLVRVNKSRLGFRAVPARFYLGTCPATRTVGEFVYFNYELNQCGSSLKMQNNHLAYSNQIFYKPEAQGEVIREVPLALPIQCLFNRFHYAYKIGYLPEVLERTYQVNLGTKRMFSLSVRSENWDTLPPNSSYMLGERMYFEAATTFISQHERVFVDSCHVTVDTTPNSNPRYDVISNFGCMVDSRRAGSLSRFISRQSNVLRFSLDAFLFPNIASKHFYLHCTISVGKVTAKTTAKSCTYSSATNRWEELLGDASVCHCCNDNCVATDLDSFSYVEHATVTSNPLRFSQKEVEPQKIQMWPNNLLVQKVQEEFNHLQNSEQEEVEVLRGGLVYGHQEQFGIKFTGNGREVEQSHILEMEVPVRAGEPDAEEETSLPAEEETQLISLAPEILKTENLASLQENAFTFSDGMWNDEAVNSSSISIAEDTSSLEHKEPIMLEKTFQDQPDE